MPRGVGQTPRDGSKVSALAAGRAMSAAAHHAPQTKIRKRGASVSGLPCASLAASAALSPALAVSLSLALARINARPSARPSALTARPVPLSLTSLACRSCPILIRHMLSFAAIAAFLS